MTKARARPDDVATAPLATEATETLPVVAALTDEAARTNQRTARLAAQMLTEADGSFVIPTARQRIAILIAYARAEHVVYGKAFDIVKCPSIVDLDDSDSIFEHLDEIVICEIKSTNKKTVRDDFGGYFFGITAAEMLVAQNLGARYCFVFVNTITRRYRELTLQQIFAKARGIYPTWSISF